MTTISNQKDYLKNLKRHYDKAVKDGKESFIFMGNEVLTTFAKYQIEYYESQLKPKK